MHYVYIIRSEAVSKQTYVGFTSNLKLRIERHNEGTTRHTAKYRPWTLEFYAAFPSKDKALAFEAYLKSHSGKAFARKRLCA